MPISRRDFCSLLGTAVAGPAVLKAAGVSVSPEKKPQNRAPNVIFLMTDQQRWDALGCNNPLVHTPNLDRLARSGIHFRQAVCNDPMCMPSRYSLMLGLYPSQTGVRCNAQMISNDDALPATPLPEIFRRAGYQTAGFGKTHWYEALGKDKMQAADFRPTTRGFEVRACEHDGVHREPGSASYSETDPDGARAMYEELKTNRDKYPANVQSGGVDGPWSFLGWPSRVPPEHHQGGWLTRQCLDFIEKKYDASRPLFLYLSLDEPHAPVRPPEKYLAHYNINDIPDLPEPPWKTKAQEPNGHVGPDAEVACRKDIYNATYPVWEKLSLQERREVTLQYWAYCSFADDLFGQVLQSLDQKGIIGNALILFCSDHGDMLGERLFRTSKYNLYDGSVRVPFILSGSAVPAARRGEVSDAPVSLVDVVPTLLGGAGLEHPIVYPGINLLDGRHSNTGSYAEYHGAGCEGIERAPALMWRTKEWKLILYSPAQLRAQASALSTLKGELYDLKNDPNEFTNLFGRDEVREIQMRMTNEMLYHIALTGSLFPRQATLTVV
jgi:arylsulfatase A-like enzyme